MRRALLGACAVLLLTGCGRESEPGQDVLGILTIGQSEDAAECQAEILLNSDMSDEGVRNVAVAVGSNTAMDDDFDLDEIASDLSYDDQREFRTVAEAFEDCLD